MTGARSTPAVLSVSQMEDFDPEQVGGCPRRWWFERVQGHRPESTPAHSDGEQGHALLARYLSTGGRPGRVRLGKAVNAVIDSGVLPERGSDLYVEERFSRQPHRDEQGRWVPLDASRTLWHAGHPWEGFIDLRFQRWGGLVTVWDHKFSSDIHARALPNEKLIRTVQMPIYALDSLRRWPDAKAVHLVHLYVSRRGVESFLRSQHVSTEQVLERAAEITALVRQMDAAREASVQDEVPFNRAACFARMGCPHQFRCNAFKRRSAMMELTDEEKQMFGMLNEETKPPVQRHQETPVSGAPGGEPPVQVVTTELRTPKSRLNLDEIFDGMAPPKPSEPKPQPAPTCPTCAAVLTTENSSRLRDGELKHIGCSAEKAPVTFDMIAGGVAERLTDTSLAVQAGAAEAALITGPKCSDCPHPAHDGRRCDGRRGRGQCRCGEAVEAPAPEAVSLAPQRPPVPPAPTIHISDYEPQAHVDDGKQVADLEGDGAAVEEASRDMEAQPPPRAAPPASWSGALAVSVTVELGPSTLAFFHSLLKR